MITSRWMEQYNCVGDHSVVKGKIIESFFFLSFQKCYHDIMKLHIVYLCQKLLTFRKQKVVQKWHCCFDSNFLGKGMEYFEDVD